MKSGSSELISRNEIDFAPGENTFGMRIFKEIWRLPFGKTRTYWKYQIPDVVLVVPFTKEGWLVTIREFQPAVIHDYPKLIGGSVETGQTPEAAAWEELESESGYCARTMELITTMALDSGRSDRKLHVFVAKGCEPVRDPEEGVEVAPMKAAEFWQSFMAYLLANPNDVHGGANSLKAVALAFTKLGILQPQGERC